MLHDYKYFIQAYVDQCAYLTMWTIGGEADLTTFTLIFQNLLDQDQECPQSMNAFL